MMQSLLGYVLYQDGYSAAMLAAWHGHTDVVVELVKAGVNLDLQNKVQNCISHSGHRGVYTLLNGTTGA